MEGAKKIVTKIDANPMLKKQNDENAFLKVAAYCRVSTDSNDQIESYKAQVTHYTSVIQKNPKWRFVDIYADEGITGTMAKKRPNFMRMIRDCEKGKIDLILTKSVARFARNTVDSLNYVRMLKAKGIGVFFEEQNLDSLKADSEMLIGFHSVMAQAESENISANVKWGIRQRMRTGTYKFRYNLLGYKKGEDGNPVIVPNEAEIIRNIFNLYINGNSLDQIKSYLESNDISTFNGSKVWTKQNIKNILTNERYSGDMLLQKYYIENCISKKIKKNNGELEKYLITNNHPAIISRELFKLTQMELSRRSGKRKTSGKGITEQGKYSGKYAFSEMLFCGNCGSPYRRCTWTYKGGKKIVWRCLNRLEHVTQFCRKSISIEESKLKECVDNALKNYFDTNKDAIDLICDNLAFSVTNDSATANANSIKLKLKELGEEMDSFVSLSENAADPQKYNEVISMLCQQMAALRNQLEIENAKINLDENLALQIEYIKSKDFKTIEYNDITYRRLIEYINIFSDKIIIRLKGGLNIEAPFE